MDPQMTDTIPHNPLVFYLRRPRFAPGDKRTPRQAVLHALAPALYLAANVWITGLLAVWLVSLPFRALPVLTLVAGVGIAIVCAIVTWAIVVRCIEVEAEMDT